MYTLSDVVVLSVLDLFPAMPRTQALVDTAFDLAPHLLRSWTMLCRQDDFIAVSTLKYRMFQT